MAGCSISLRVEDAGKARQVRVGAGLGALMGFANQVHRGIGNRLSRGSIPGDSCVAGRSVRLGEEQE